MSEKIIKASCEMIIEKNDKVLLALRKNIFGSGEWCFPGGHLEYGESSLVCAKRELKEEIGIDATRLELVAVINDTPHDQGGHYIRFVYRITAWEGKVVNAEPDYCEKIGWFDLDNLPKPFFVGDKKVLPIYLNKVNCKENIKVLEE